MATAGVLCALLAVPALNFFPLAAAADALPSTAPYLGEIRRDASGKLIVTPAADTASTASPPASGPTRILRVGPQQATRSIAAAAALAQDGDTIEIEAGDYVGDVAVWKQSELVIRGVGGRVRLIAAGASAEKKAIWVIRGGDITIENIEFTGARVPGRNGAGIRFEKGRLVIRNCRFLDNEMGILTGAGDAELDIEDSEFAHNGRSDGHNHNLYVGAIKKLRVTGSYFHHATIGHLLKSRAAENHILYNRLTDENGGRASYELEFPNGGIAYVIGNIIQQSATTENPNIISYGAEGYKWPKNELYLINNTLINDRPEGGSFLAVWPGTLSVKAYNNLLLGKRPLNTGIDGEFINNPSVDVASFVLADRHDYRIRRESPLHRTYQYPGVANNGMDLTPTREYVHPAATRPLNTTPTLPGARQTLQPDKVPGG
ncbi:MAG: right-handed parallel beta-helix repeat-containing protein [Rhodocyclaceae bacterium]|nr:right-handed parallel beta-helix repeat-containing protein [Rhodocyclaceae bacterium]